MWIRKRLDVSWRDLAAAAVRCVLPFGHGPSNDQIAHAWFPADQSLACLSVRSGFDLLLSALELPPGSEVIMSAINIADMAKIAEAHDLTVVPVDVDSQSLHPTCFAVEAKLTANTRMMVMAHLFGDRADIDELAKLLADHDVLLVEDCAQAFVGSEYAGHPKSDVAMFSFGPIKTATALGGAVMRIRSEQLRQRMRDAYSQYPQQSSAAYALRVARFSLLKLLSTRWLFSAVVHVLRWLGRDYDRFIHRRTRIVADAIVWQRALRRRACPPLRYMLRRRIQSFDAQRIVARRQRGMRLLEQIAGEDQDALRRLLNHTFWVAPFTSDDRQTLAAVLADQGFDVAQRSSLVALPPTDSHIAPAPIAESWIRSVVFLPAYEEMPISEIDRLASAIRGFASQDATQTHSAQNPAA